MVIDVSILTGLMDSKVIGQPARGDKYGSARGVNKLVPPFHSFFPLSIGHLDHPPVGESISAFRKIEDAGDERLQGLQGRSFGVWRVGDCERLPSVGP
jgi:hypothetical protein